MTKVINFYAPPSSGKSTLAAACYVSKGYQGELAQLVEEHIKTFADRNQYLPTAIDQPWIMGNQSQLIWNAIQAKYSHVFCQSDPLLCAWYADYYSPGPLSQSLKLLALTWEEEVCRKTDTEFHRFFIELPESLYQDRYKEAGRWQKFNEIISMQKHMKNWLMQLQLDNFYVIHETRPELVFKNLGE